MDDKVKKSADFILGNKAADLWLYTCDACANEKVIPKRYRYTTGTGLMNTAEEICDMIEGANLLDLRENPGERLAIDTLWLAYMRARRCKRSKRSTAAFEYSAIEELLILSKSLLQGKYTPDPLDAFFIYEPKKRLIQAPTFRDKVVQHAQNDFVIYPELSRSMTLNTYAAQYGKGTHFGVDQLEGNLRTHFLRRKGADEAARKAAGLPYRPIEEWDYADGAVIKGDIRHFFQSIDHELLKRALAERFHDERLQGLMWKYIDAVEGLALGHQTSHIYAVFFVHSVMHFINEKLRLPLSGMYMDDWYVICPTWKRPARRWVASGRSFPNWGWN